MTWGIHRYSGYVPGMRILRTHTVSLDLCFSAVALRIALPVFPFNLSSWFTAPSMIPIISIQQTIGYCTPDPSSMFTVPISLYRSPNSPFYPPKARSFAASKPRENYATKKKPPLSLINLPLNPTIKCNYTNRKLN